MSTKQELEKLNNNNIKGEKFVKPTLEEIRQEVTDKNLDRIDPAHFFEHHEENGWTKANGQKSQTIGNSRCLPGNAMLFRMVGVLGIVILGKVGDIERMQKIYVTVWL